MISLQTVENIYLQNKITQMKFEDSEYAKFRPYHKIR